MTIRRSVASMAAATVASRILGLVRVVVIAAVLGTTALGNTFQSTNSISNVLFDLLAAGALSAALVPQLVRALMVNNDELKRITSSLITLVLIILGAISIAGIILAEPIASWLFSRAPQATQDAQIATGTILLRFFMPQILLYGFGAIAIAVLTAKKRFVITVLAPIGSSLFMIGAVAVFGFVRSGSSVAMPLRETIILGIAGTGACLAFVAIPVYFCFRSGVPLLPSTNFKSGLSVLSTSVWAVAIQASAAIILVATLFMGNQLNGAVVAYQLAFVFFLAPYAIISQSFSTVLLPDLSQSATKEKTSKEFSGIVANMLTWTYRPMLVVTAACIALYRPVIDMVTEGRAQSGQHMVEIAFISLVIGIVPYSVFQATSRIFFAKSNIRLPALTILFSSVAISAGAVIGTRYVSGNALLAYMGLTHTFAYCVAAVVLLSLLHKDGYRVFPDRMTYLVCFASVVYATVGVLVVRFVDVHGRWNSFLYSCVYLIVTLLIGYCLMGAKQRTKVHAMIASTIPSSRKAS